MPYQTLFFLVLGLALIALLIAGAGLLAAWDPARPNLRLPSGANYAMKLAWTKSAFQVLSSPDLRPEPNDPTITSLSCRHKGARMCLRG